MNDGHLACIPEWCGQGEEHDKTCPEAPMPDFTKKDFVTAAESGARAAIADYLFLANDELLSHEDAVEIAVGQAMESAMCFAGIGSCGRGWCKHS